MFPDAWEDYVEPIPPAERGDLLRAYYKRLVGDDEEARVRCAKAWSVWEARTSFMRESAELVAKNEQSDYALAFARIEAHYFVNRGFFEKETQLLDDVARIRNIPGVIVQGRYDVVCPMESAWALHRAWPEADLRIVPDAGHAALEEGTLHELIVAADKFMLRR